VLLLSTLLVRAETVVYSKRASLSYAEGDCSWSPSKGGSEAYSGHRFDIVCGYLGNGRL
jgi:hypothetical protein